MFTRITIMFSLALAAACGGRKPDAGPPASRGRTPGPQGLVLAGGNASAPGGHRVVAGVLGGAGESGNDQHMIRGVLRP